MSCRGNRQVEKINLARGYGVECNYALSRALQFAIDGAKSEALGRPILHLTCRHTDDELGELGGIAKGFAVTHRNESYGFRMSL